MNNRYHFVTHWQFAGNCELVYDIIGDPLQYPRWWPKVYLEAEEIVHSEEGGIGQRVRLHTKGWLPYKLRWEALTTEVQPPRKLAIRAFGDFEGRGIWTLEQQGTFVNVVFDWKLTAEKPLLKYVSFLLKPLFSANHRWAMEQGRRGLEKEIARLSQSMK